tara:strand:- start:288 stop:911 length:624 start_codon:yes stop_codon:yes gene_type:complete
MNLPKKDKKGKSYLSYSQISLFKRDKEEYKDIYINNRKFEGNEYTDFGSKVGEALEKNNFDSFTLTEGTILKMCTRLDIFERRTILDYDKYNFYVVGYIDTIDNDLTTIIDYKTGGKNKELQYKEDNYFQIQLYALSIMQETGIEPKKGLIEFIRRKGNAFKGEKLIIGNEPPIKIDIDLSMDRLKKVYWDILKTAKEIEKFYLENK